MTYANDVIEIRDRERRRGLKRITSHSSLELDAAIETARRRFGNDFWLLLHGIDAYMERRQRRANARFKKFAPDLEEEADPWGNS